MHKRKWGDSSSLLKDRSMLVKAGVGVLAQLCSTPTPALTSILQSFLQADWHGCCKGQSGHMSYVQYVLFVSSTSFLPKTTDLGIVQG